jgi:hypothetical protein
MPTISAAIDQERRQALQSAYQIGRAIDRAYHWWKLAAPVIDGEDLEAHFIEQISNSLMEPEDWLHSQWRLAQAFDEEQFQRLCDAPGVSIISIEPLLEVDSEARSQLLDKIVADGLTGRKLEAAIQQLAVSA